ncbi:MAG: hypothetical protein ABMA64_31995 [Myxococcota bacterium]
MHDEALTWLPDGFSIELHQPEDESSPVRPVLWAYAATLPTVALALQAGFVPMLSALLLPLPAALLWSALRPRRISIHVDHQRIRVRGAFGGRLAVELRRVRDVAVTGTGLELLLHSGERVSVHAPAPYDHLRRLARAIGEVRDEVHRFESEVRQRTADFVQIGALRAKGRS